MCEQICTIMVEDQSVSPSSSECRTIPSQAAYSSSVASQCSQLQSNPTFMRHAIREADLFHIILKSIILQIHSCSFKFFSVSWIASKNPELQMLCLLLLLQLHHQHMQECIWEQNKTQIIKLSYQAERLWVPQLDSGIVQPHSYVFAIRSPWNARNRTFFINSQELLNGACSCIPEVHCATQSHCQDVVHTPIK